MTRNDFNDLIRAMIDVSTGECIRDDIDTILKEASFTIDIPRSCRIHVVVTADEFDPDDPLYTDV